MMKRIVTLLVLVLGFTLAFFACGGATKQEGALVLVISTDLSLADMNGVRLEVSQETGPGTYGPALVAKDFALPGEATLPATFTVAAGKSASQTALVRVIGKKDSAPVVLREVEVIVPADRVLALPMVLAAACASQVKVDSTGRVVSTCPNARESCQPATGACGPSFVDSNTLAPYSPSSLPPITDAAASGTVGPTEKEITSFVLAGVTGTISGSDVFVSLPPGTNAKSIAPTIKWRGKSITPDPATPQDFDKNIAYVVTAMDGSERVYTVHVSIALPDSKKIESFVVAGANTLYSFTTDEIDLEVPFGFDVKNVTPTIAFVGKSIDPPSLAKQDFTNPVTYTVTAYDGSTRAYVVTAVVQAADAAEIKTFKINGAEGTVFTDTVDLKLTNGGELKNLTPEITFTGKSIEPPSGKAQDFTNPVKYTVTSADGTKKAEYVVTVTRAQVSKVTFSPLGGIYGHTLGVKLSCKSLGAEVRYTTDGSEPTTTSTLFDPSAPISIAAVTVAKNIKARCFSPKFDPAQQSTFQIYTVNGGGLDAPDEIVFGPTKCGQQAAAKTFALGNTGAAQTYTTDTPEAFTVTPASGTAAASTGTTITVTPQAVPATLDDLEDIAETVSFTFAPSTNQRSVTLRQLVTCP